MIGFGLDSELDKHLAALSARRVSELTPHDYIRAVRLLCTERSPHHAGRRHASPMDFDQPDMDPVFDLLADVTTCRLKGRNTELPALYERVTDVLLAVLNIRLADKLVNVRQDAMHKRRQALHIPYTPREDDDHARELADDARVERAQANARLGELIAERVR